MKFYLHYHQKVLNYQVIFFLVRYGYCGHFSLGTQNQRTEIILRQPMR